LDGGKMAYMGWNLPITFESSLEKSIHWFIDNPKWLG